MLLVGGGSGVVPLMAMLRHRRRTMPELPMRLVYSVRSADEVIYADELGDDTLLTYTRQPPPGWTGHTGRIDAALIAEAAPASGTAFVCGSNGFVEAAAALLLGRGLRARTHPHRALRPDGLTRPRPAPPPPRTPGLLGNQGTKIPAAIKTVLSPAVEAISSGPPS